MKRTGYPNRRSFLKTSAAGAAGLALSGMVTRSSYAAWTEAMQINPAVPNDRVVCCHDNLMCPWGKDCDGNDTWNCSHNETNFPATMDHSFVEQNELLDSARMWANMDAMAKSLTGKPDAAQAWPALFMKPETKTWDQVRVAIKLDANANNIPHIPVVGKVCGELIAAGVLPGNIILYDGEAYAWNSETSKVESSVEFYYKQYVGNGLPDGIVISRFFDALGGTVMTAIPEPFEGSFPCAAAIADGTIDILINLACDKAHGTVFGGASFCLKNHVGGTFLRQFTQKGLRKEAFNLYEWTRYQIAVNKSDAILGGTPPRQQLCIIDAIWGNHCCGPMGFHHGPGGQDLQPNRLIMGTFAPLVDIAAINLLPSSHTKDYFPGDQKDKPIVMAYLTEFGYPESMRDLGFLMVPPA